jgi:replicative DNA helicase
VENLKENLDVIGGGIAVLAVIWQMSQVKSAIDKAIDAVKDDALARHLVLEKRFEIHLENYILRQEAVNMLTSQLNEKIDHKHSRTYASLRDIEKYLQKHHSETFRVREYFDDESRPL